MTENIKPETIHHDKSKNEQESKTHSKVELEGGTGSGLTSNRNQITNQGNIDDYFGNVHVKSDI